MATKIIYHQVKPGVDCPDGIAAAWICAKRYPDAQLLGWTYQSESLPTVAKGDYVFIVDFSFSGDVIERWIREGVFVTVIDHHKTAQEALSRFFVESFAQSLAHDNNAWQVEFDMDECGATLTWKTLFGNSPTPAFLEYVRDRDLWNHALPFTEEIHEATASLGRTFALFDELESLTREQLIEWLAPIGEKLLASKRARIAAAADRCQLEELLVPSGMDYTVPVVRLAQDGSEDRLASDICSRLYKLLPNALFVACVTSDGSWSLRSDKNGNNTDVGAIAKAMGGGGHHNASGFKP